MATLLERISDLAHFTRTPSLTDTDDSAPSDDLSDPPAITESPVDDSTTMKHPLLRSTSKTSHATTRMRASSVSSTLMLRFQRPLVVALTESQVLGCLLRYLSWHEFRNLVGTSRAVRDALDTEASMDRILTRFVPAYRPGVRPDDQMRISLDDLESFMLSQHTSLHLYPTHALSVVDSLLNMMHLASSTTERFQGLTAAHSKFVLLLRSRALAAPHPPEVDDQPPTPPPVVPQLVFPAPLFFAQPKNTMSTSAPATLTKQGSQRRASLTSLLSLSRSSSRRKPIPPPAPQPRASISVSFNKRSSTYLSRSYNPPARSKSTPPQTHTDDDLSVLKPPRPWCRRHSSLPGSSASSSRGSLAAVSEKASRLGSGPLLPTGPHDLLYAAVPGRAPILRVFVPTDVLSPESIRACEMLLYRAGLWEWMKPGDIVCNLGYVPREESNANSPVDQFGRFQSNEVRQTEWLVFTGSALIPYFPPAPPPPDIDILSLPGPAYYSHLATAGPTHLHLPGLMDEPSMAVAGLVYALSIPKRSTEPTMRLDSGVGYVKSSRGITRVSRAVWIASFIVDKPRHGRKGKSKSTLADEWTGEWVLEGMGTREGERGLRDAMDDGQVRFWEWVREKSGPGRIWLRLLDAPVLGVTEPVPPVPPIPANLSA